MSDSSWPSLTVNKPLVVIRNVSLAKIPQIRRQPISPRRVDPVHPFQLFDDEVDNLKRILTKLPRGECADRSI
jgi:hypothetical protein